MLNSSTISILSKRHKDIFLDVASLWPATKTDAEKSLLKTRHYISILRNDKTSRENMEMVKYLNLLSRISSSFQKKMSIDVRTYYIHTCNNIKQWAQTRFKVAFELHKKLPNL